MAQFPGITLTNAGLNMIAESQATSTALIFTKLKMGDGNLTVGEDIKTLTAVKNPMLTAAIQSYTNQGDGQVKLRFTISNGTLTTGFFAREIGIYAKVGAGGTEQLYAYTNAGNLTDYIPDKNTPIDEQIIDIYLVVGNASSVQIITDSSIMYVTMTDLNEHKSSGNAHPEIISAHNNDENAHPGLKTLVEKAGAMPIGAIMSFLMKSAPEGWLALDTGALVSRATYPDLWAWVQENAPLISETDWQTQASAQSSVGFFSTGDGSTTFRLPRILDYVRGSTLADVGVWQEAGLPNILGAYSSSKDAEGFAGFTGAVSGSTTSGIGTAGHFDNGWLSAQLNFRFDASKSNAIYGNSTTVTPKTIKMVYCIKAFGATTNQGMIDITALANDLNYKLSIVDYEIDRAMTIIYPNGGSEGSPANMSINSRYENVIPAGFEGHELLCRAEVLVDGKWGDPGWHSYYAGGHTAFGVKSGLFDGKIITQVGKGGCLIASNLTGGSLLYPTETILPSLPCRVKVYKLAKIGGN